MVFHQFRNSHRVCLNFPFIVLDFVVTITDLSLQHGNLTKRMLILLGKFNRRQTGLACTVDTGQRFHGQRRLHTAHGGRLIVRKAPDPFIQTLKDHVLHSRVALDFRHCQISFGIIAPDTGKGTMLNIGHRQIETQLELVIQGHRIIHPAVSFMVCTALAL